MDKIIQIDGKDVGMRATARTPRLYRNWFGRDLVQDMSIVTAAAAKNEPLNIESLNVFENLAYTFARQYDETITCTADEWLDGFAVMSIYEVWPHILDLWIGNQATTSSPKKA